tara:strand:+ start:362 stop:547 length:186 start_codon:yes stop_codon:yes gene_type:complete
MQIEGEWKMDMATIVGALISGFATRIYGAGVAVWVAIEASTPIKNAMGTVDATLTAVNTLN